MDHLLYYPYINLPRTEWTLRALLYYDTVGTIVPQAARYAPEEFFDPFMTELLRDGLVEPLEPFDHLPDMRRTCDALLGFAERFARLTGARSTEAAFMRIHAQKFDAGLFRELETMGLARRSSVGWYDVERRTANQLMKFLALVLGHATGRQPATDRLHPLYRPTAPGRQRKRDRILEELLPLPEQLDLRRLRTFKERHAELLARFRTQVELLVLDDGTAPDTPLFALRLEELRHRRDELAARMNEGRLGRVLFGTVCGMLGAAHALASDTTPAALIGGLPGFASAVYAAIGNCRRVDPDPAGLKYLVLLDRRRK